MVEERWCDSCTKVGAVNASLPSLHRRVFDPSEPNEEEAQIRRLRSLLSLFALYVAVLLLVVVSSDGADIGCVLIGVAGHVVYASVRTAMSWRDAMFVATARSRVRARA